MARTIRLPSTIGWTCAISCILCSQVAQADAVRDAEWPLESFHAAASVWPHSRGNAIRVAVIDSGVRASHADLSGRVIKGFDFISSGDGQRDHDADGHGTAMASLIAGHGHGLQASSGIFGLAPNSSILPVAINVDSAVDDETSAAIRYAVDHGATIINMSFGYPSSSTKNRQAISYAEEHDVLMVASVGNDGSAGLTWPAAYPGVVAVGAVDVDGKVWEQSNYGPGLTLTAPGVNIVAAGANSDSEYRLSDGTSDAAAYVSAEAALIRAEYPKLTAGQVVNRMIKSAVNPTGKVHDDHYGYGIIRPDAALTFDIPPGPPGGPLGQVGQVGSAAGVAGGTESVAPGGGAAVVAQGGKGGGRSGMAVGGAVAAAVVVGAGGVWWVRRRRKRVG